MALSLNLPEELVYGVIIVCVLLLLDTRWRVRSIERLMKLPETSSELDSVVDRMAAALLPRVLRALSPALGGDDAKQTDTRTGKAGGDGSV